jgi:hypothetical protein
VLKGVRAAVDAALRTAVQSSGALLGLVVSAGQVVSLAAAAGAARRPPLQQWDVLLLLNFLHANESLKRAETFSPLCLPTFNPNGHLHAYIQFVSSATNTAIVLAGGAVSDFHSMASARREMQEQLESVGALQAVLEAAVEQAGARAMLHPENLPALAGGGPLGESPLVHFAYKLTAAQQFVMSPFPPDDAMPDLQQASNVSLFPAASELACRGCTFVAAGLPLQMVLTAASTSKL